MFRKITEIIGFFLFNVFVEEKNFTDFWKELNEKKKENTLQSDKEIQVSKSQVTFVFFSSICFFFITIKGTF